MVSDMMEINGYGYQPFQVTEQDIVMPEYRIPIQEGEFILNLFDGRKQRFQPLYFDFHGPSEHTVDGEHFDLEMHILHEYKGTDQMLGAVIAIFFNMPEGSPKENEGKNLLFENIFAVQDNDISSPMNVGL